MMHNACLYHVYTQIGSTAEGVINGIEANVYNDSGWSPNEAEGLVVAVNNMDNGNGYSNIRYDARKVTDSDDEVRKVPQGLVHSCQ